MDSLGLAYCGIFYLIFFKEKPNKKNFVTLSTLRPSLSIFQKMPRKYIRKSARNSWDTNAMALAIAAVESGEMGFLLFVSLVMSLGAVLPYQGWPFYPWQWVKWPPRTKTLFLL